MKTFIFIFTLLFAMPMRCGIPVPQVAEMPPNAQEWLLFKQAAEITIRNNEVHIADLKAENIYLGKEFDINYQKKVGKAAQQNKEIRERIAAFQIEKNDFSTFKHQIKVDMRFLAKTLNQLTLANQQK